MFRRYLSSGYRTQTVNVYATTTVQTSCTYLISIIPYSMWRWRHISVAAPGVLLRTKAPAPFIYVIRVHGTINNVREEHAERFFNHAHPLFLGRKNDGIWIQS